MSIARITWISGPVLRVNATGPFVLREAVHVGEAQLLGEVIRINEDEIVAQVYEDTTGLRPGVNVHGTGDLLSVRLGPALLGNMFDGLLRPLARSSVRYIEPGTRATEKLKFRFVPRLRVGEQTQCGGVLGEALAEQGRSQSILCLLYTSPSPRD